MITTVVKDVWCDQCAYGWPDVVLVMKGDCGEGECGDGHPVEVCFEVGDL